MEQAAVAQPRIYRSARECTGALLLEQAGPGDFVKVGGAGPGAGGMEVFGRVLGEEDPELEGRRPQMGKVFVRAEDGTIQEFNVADLEQQQATMIPSDKLKALTTPADEGVMEDVMQDLARRRSKKRSDDPFKDREKSMTQRFAQRNPLTRVKKSDKMKKHWRGVQHRASYQGGGLAQESLEEQGLNQPEFESDYGPSEEEVTPSSDQFGLEPTRMASKDVIDSEAAWQLTQRTFELADDMIRALSIHKGMVYFEEMRDDAEEGTVTITLNGTAPREVIDQFMSEGAEDIDIELIEEPEGTLEDRDLRGRWVVTGKVILPEEEFGEEAGPDQYQVRGKYPGEISAEEIEGVGGGAVSPTEVE